MTRPAIPIQSSISTVAPDAQAWLVDIWGVLHNGARAFPAACEACRTFRSNGGIVVLISNAPRPFTAVVPHLTSLGGERLLYILDEPTTGLHFDDIAKLLAAFRKLLEAGHTLVVIEHNLDVIKVADWIIDLGPEGGEDGGQLVAMGTPEQVAHVPASHTGRFLQEILSSHKLFHTVGR